MKRMLKRCPCCSSFKVEAGVGGMEAVVQCKDCGLMIARRLPAAKDRPAGVPWPEVENQTLSAAVDAWNRRPKKEDE